MKSQDANPMRQVLIVDDHPMTRYGLMHLLKGEPDLCVCAEAGNAGEALDAAIRCKPDLVLTDLSLPGKSGIELVKDLHAQFPEMPILVVSMHDERVYAERLLRTGARGYIMKEEGSARIIQAIRQVLAGEVYVSEQMSRKALQAFANHRDHKSAVESLSDREFEVFELLGHGLDTHDIAGRLHLSPRTVDVHRANIREKLTMHSNAELIAYAARWFPELRVGGEGAARQPQT